MDSVYIFKHIRYAAAATMVSAAVAGCITNDLPYPAIQANFTSFMVEDMAGAAQIDTLRRTVVLPLAEQADMSAVRVLGYELSPSDAVLSPGYEIPTVLDLTSPYRVDLSVYRSYEWTISATQTIARYFNVEGQIGASFIDVDASRVVVTVPKDANLRALKVTSVKLGAVSSVMSPDLNGETVDMRDPVTVEVTDHGRVQKWTIYVEKSADAVAFRRVDAWTRVAYLYAEAEANKTNGFEYRIKGDTEWSAVPAEWITADGGTFKARLVHLSPETVYEARAFSDADFSEMKEFVTGSEPQMPNSDFDLWWLSKKVWNPWAEGGESYWDTGNKGAATMGQSNSIPSDQTVSGTGYCAELQSKFVGLGPVGKLASGSIFTGEYLRTDGTNGVLKFGRRFTSRPTRLTGYVRYSGAPISSIGSEPQFADWRDRPDTGNVYVALTSWADPLEVRTNPRDRQLFDPQDPGVIAYGRVEYTGDTDGWVPFSIDIDYRTTSVAPTHILVVAAASKWGDYFVGGSGSVMFIDDFKLEYDY